MTPSRPGTRSLLAMLLPLVLLACDHRQPVAAPAHSLYSDSLIIGRIARPYVDTAPDDLVVSNESRNGHAGEEIRYVGTGTFVQTGDMARIAVSCVEHGDIFTRKLLVNLSFLISDLNRAHQANAAISEWKTLSDTTEEFPLTRSIDLIDRSGTVLIDYEDLPPDGSIHAVVSILRTAIGKTFDGSPLIIRQLVTGRLRLTRSPERPDLPDPDLTRLGTNPCDGIRDSQFKSVEAFDTGVGPDGMPAMGPLFVEFRDGVVRFQVTDTVLTAGYVCADGDISGHSASGDFRGHYDPAKGTLTWNGHEYERVK